MVFFSLNLMFTFFERVFFIGFVNSLVYRLEKPEHLDEPKGEVESFISQTFVLTPKSIIFDKKNYKWKTAASISVLAKAVPLKIEFKDEQQNCVQVSEKKCNIDSGFSASFTFSLLDEDQIPLNSSFKIFINDVSFLIPILIEN